MVLLFFFGDHMNIETGSINKEKKEIVVLGGGLSGLSAAHILSMAGRQVIVFEADPVVGGLSKTIVHNLGCLAWICLRTYFIPATSLFALSEIGL